jgi:hypothetical protein
MMGRRRQSLVVGRGYDRQLSIEDRLDIEDEVGFAHGVLGRCPGLGEAAARLAGSVGGGGGFPGMAGGGLRD